MPFALRLEANWLELTTTDCNYATVVYQFEDDVASGTVISGEVAWATLVSLDPAIGTLAIASARDGLLWTHKVPNPGKADIVPIRFVLGQLAQAGSGLYWLRLARNELLDGATSGDDVSDTSTERC